MTRSCSITLRWTPAHKGVEGNKVAEEYAKVATESAWDATDRRYLREASLAHLTRRTTEARTQTTRDWIASHAKSSGVQAPDGQHHPSRPQKEAKGNGRAVLPAPFGIRLSWGLPGRQDRKDSVERVLVARQWRGGRAWPALRMHFSFCLSFVVYISFPFNRSYSFLGALGMEEKEKPHFEGRRPHRVISGRGWGTGYACKTHRRCHSPLGCM